MNPHLDIEEPARAVPAPPRFALWELGFRPFYLLASGFAALWLAARILVLTPTGRC